MGKFGLGDFVLLKGSTGYLDYERHHGLIIEERRLLGFLWKQYLCIYKVKWSDLGYVEDFYRWRRAGRLIRDWRKYADL